MEYIILTLLLLSAIVFIFSFLRKDRLAELEQEIEQLSLSYMQDIYQLKKKISVLEEELLFQESPEYSDAFPAAIKEKSSVHEIIKNQVLALYRQGLSIERIAHQSNLQPNEIISIIDENQQKERPI
ncbi:hypothetical protein JOC77_002746 [Peribacillus deserti]|uniref:Resolvase HTH domain-containing protein n=1 Tax=Peribacillus deserti TaxID=673318 RepID=A0ABS2QJI4_9BACI|nr:hypothetical protein [Peribacillus deserti]MBM7693306.1 hypothetical protein [Peribacillus deserti]